MDGTERLDGAAQKMDCSCSTLKMDWFKGKVIQKTMVYHGLDVKPILGRLRQIPSGSFGPVPDPFPTLQKRPINSFQGKKSGKPKVWQHVLPDSRNGHP